MKQNPALPALYVIIGMFFCVSAAAQSAVKVDFYGVASQDADKNMISMTEDLYLTQLKDSSVQLTDRRSTDFSQNYFDTGNADISASDKDAITFYAVITKRSDSKWECATNMKKLSEGKEVRTVKEYDSYYKIFSESKATLSDLLASFMQQGAGSSSYASQPQNDKPAQNRPVSVSTQAIAGTWSGDEYIDKVVIMRGGRGFIIFKNGASMSITISISENNADFPVTISQAGGSNASFFPELPRTVALEVATNAKPVEWRLRLEGDSMLRGTKRTLVQKSEQQPPEEASLPAEWTKRF